MRTTALIINVPQYLYAYTNILLQATEFTGLSTPPPINHRPVEGALSASLEGVDPD